MLILQSLFLHTLSIMICIQIVFIWAWLSRSHLGLSNFRYHSCRFRHYTCTVYKSLIYNVFLFLTLIMKPIGRKKCKNQKRKRVFVFRFCRTDWTDLSVPFLNPFFVRNLIWVRSEGGSDLDLRKCTFKGGLQHQVVSVFWACDSSMTSSCKLRSRQWAVD